MNKKIQSQETTFSIQNGIFFIAVHQIHQQENKIRAISEISPEIQAKVRSNIQTRAPRRIDEEIDIQNGK